MIQKERYIKEGKQHGPVARNIMSEVLPYLGINPNEEKVAVEQEDTAEVYLE